MKNQWTKAVLTGLWMLCLDGCQVPDPEPSPYEAGAYVVNAGDPLAGNGSISFLPQNSATVSTDIFNAANARPLTGGVQDFTEINGKGVILVDNSMVGQDKIEIVESGTFKALATFQAPDAENPRYVVQAGPNKAYVSCWDTTGGASNFYAKPGYILVLDLASRTVVKKIPVAKGADRIVVAGSEAFVGSAGGERSLTIIDTEKDEVKQPGLDVGVNTNPLAIDANGRLWAYVSSANEMVRINTATKVVELRMKVGDSARSPRAVALSKDRQTFYFVNSFYDPADNSREKGETYSFRIDATSIPTTRPFIRRLFSGLGVDPQTGYIYAGVTPSLKQAGYVLRYEDNGTSAVLIDSVKAEISPSKFYFR